MSGTVFAALLASAESGRVIGKLPLGRAATWGLLGTAAFPILDGKYDQVVPLGAVGIAIALALVRIGRRGARYTAVTPSSLTEALCAWVFVSLREATTQANTNRAT